MDADARWQETGADFDPAGGERVAGWDIRADPGGAGWVYRAVPRPRDAAAGAILLQAARPAGRAHCQLWSIRCWRRGIPAAAAVDLLKKASGAKNIRFLCLLAAPEGIARMKEAHPDVPIVTAAVDSHLNDHGYIVPGLGDAGDRMFGTK